MPRVSLTRVLGLPDILSTTDFEFIIGAIPNGGTDVDMVVKCQQVSYPGMGQEAFEVPLHGHVVYFRGRKTYPHQLQVSYVDDVRMDTTINLENWFEYIVGSLSGTSGDYKAGYTTNNAVLNTYDTTGALVKQVAFFGLQPTDKPDVQYDGGSSQPYVVTVTFTYDYYTKSGVASR